MSEKPKNHPQKGTKVVFVEHFVKSVSFSNESFKGRTEVSAEMKRYIESVSAKALRSIEI